jgi:DNA mismatch repair protein MutS2
VELDPLTLAPTYRLTTGLPGRSWALAIATSLGLPRDVIEAARAHLSPAQRDAEELLKELQQERHLAEVARVQAEKALSEAEAKSALLDAELAQIQDKKVQILEEARHEVRQKGEVLVRTIKDVEERLQRALHDSSGLPAQVEVAQAHRQVASVRRELASREWQPASPRRSEWIKALRPGDRVYLSDMPRPVEVVSPPADGDTVEVLLGAIRARIPAYRLERPAPPLPVEERSATVHVQPSPRPAQTELDLRGMRVEEALDRIEGFLSRGAVAGQSTLKIIHGVGTGALRSAIREHLSNHPLVKEVKRDGGFASDGATVVELA